MAYKDNAKQWFELGDKPTPAQFSTLFDQLRWTDQPLSINDINGLMEALQLKADDATIQQILGEQEMLTFNADGTYDIPAGYLLEKIIVMPGADTDVSIGTAVGLDDIQPSQTMSATRGAVVTLNLFAKALRRIYFTGLNANTSIIFFKKKILTL
jgi:hypothetical protein